MPGSNPLGSLFGRSPIKPIQEHMQVAHEAASMLPAFFQASADGDWGEAERLLQEINDAERRADKLKRSVRRHLPKSLFLPVPRSDLLELITIQDHVANVSEDIAGLIMGRKMQFPKSLRTPLMDLVETCCATTAQSVTAISELDELLEVGFSGRQVKLVEGMLKELDKLEGRADKKTTALRARLFKLEDDLKPVDVIFYYKIIELLAGVADAAERVGHRLQILMAK